MTQIVGVVPARMGSSRFPGKPLHLILGQPMVEHVFDRASLYTGWTELVLATCDDEIATLGRENGWPVIMTSSSHSRAMDRVAEAAALSGVSLGESDIVVNVQGDEPMLHPEMIDALVQTLVDDPSVDCTLLAMEIIDEAVYQNPDTVHVVHNLEGFVLYMSRSPIPHCKSFSPALGARRNIGIFAFRWGALQEFTQLPESPLEISEAIDFNRALDHGFRQKMTPFPYQTCYCVDSLKDAEMVEEALRNDPLWHG